MALTLHNATVAHGTASATVATNVHTATAGSCLLVWTHANEATSLSAVRAGGVSLTRLAAVSAGTSRSELWGLTAHTAGGILTITAQPVGASLMALAVIATSFVGQQQGTSPFGGTQIGTAAAATLAVSLSATATDLVVVGFCISANTAVVLNAGATTVASATHSTTGRLVVGTIPGAATVSASASASASGAFGVIGIHLLAKPDPIESLADNFSADTITSGVWAKFSSTSDASASITISSSAVVIVPGAGVAGAAVGFPEPAWGVNSTSVFTFSGSKVYARIDPAFVDQELDFGTVRTNFGVINADPVGFDQPNDEGIGFEIVGPTTNQRIHCLVWGDVADTAQVTANAATISYIAANHAWFQLRNDGTNIFWEAAPDSGGAPGTFSALASMTVASISTFDSTSLWLHRSRIRFWTKVVDGSYSATFLTQPARMYAVNTADSALAVVTASMSATEAFADTFSASAQVRVTARLSATEAFSDTLSASAKVRVTTRLSATDAQDTFAATIQNRISVRLSATEAFADTFSSSANVRVAATMAATETVADTFAASANVRVAASMSATDTADTFVASAQVVVTAALAATDAPDTFAASATVVQDDGRITAAVSATDTPDTFVASAYVVVTARMSATDAPDIFLATTPAAPRDDAPSSAGHGDKRNDEYQPANDAFWEARERYLLSLQPEIQNEPTPEISPSKIGTVEPAPVPKLLIELRFERREALTSIEHARNMRQLRAAGKRLRAINQRILEQKLAAAQAEVAAIHAIIDEPRQRKMRLLRRKLSLLQMAHSLLKLQDHL